jgi:nucleotide-binding universal stress UspA family protein
MFTHILIPTDGSEPSKRAVEAGVALAKALGARVTGMYAAPAPTPVVFKNFLPVGYSPPDEHAAAIERAARRYLGVIEAAAAAAGVACDTVHLTSEYPADTILDVAKRRKCDLVFMASHGHTGLAGLLLGSETQKVLAHAKIPVLVYR